MQTQIQYVLGDATCPFGTGPRVIAHIVNTVGGWGRGFVLSLSDRWHAPEEAYRNWARGPSPDFRLGAVQFVEVEPNLWVANIVGQEGIYSNNGVAPIRYEALREGLQQVYAFALGKGAAVHAPRLGAGLAGGRWDKIEPMLIAELCSKGIPVTIYDIT